VSQALSVYLAELGVSRETEAALNAMAEQVQKWNVAINLVSRSTMQDISERHVLDSAQIYVLAPQSTKKWVDLGSGGGFPGLVIAILARELSPHMRVTLVESDHRKSSFLKIAAANLGLGVEVLTTRAEETEPLNADVLSARALAPLDVLFKYSEMHLVKPGVALFPKGASYAEEIAFAGKAWSFTSEAIQSRTDEHGKILKIRDICRV
jgi:16S rRNA (guanine527-N7)-methyltransferase